MSTASVGAAPMRIGPGRAARHGLALAGRGVTRFLRTPAQLVDVILTPIVFLLMFVYLFGAIGAGDLDGYLRGLVPGIMVITVLHSGIGVGVSLNADAGSGVFDRFRSMPIARSAPLVGAVLAGIVRYLVSLGPLVALALGMGYRVQTGPVAALAGVALLIGFALSFSWMSVCLGMLVRTPGSVRGLTAIVVLPLTFASNVFVPSRSMPGRLRVWSEFNPVSLAADALRGLLNGGAVAGPLLGALVWMAVVVAVFLPPAVWAYRRKGA